MSAQRRKGTGWENAVVEFLRENGFPHVERRVMGGIKDRGDVAGIPGIVIEAKNAARMEIAGWLKEAETERTNDGADLGIVWAKRRGKGSAGDGYAILTGAQLVALLRAAGYGTPGGQRG